MEGEFEKLRTGNDPDYELINLLIDYLKTYPDAVHHRKEDLVYRALKLKSSAGPDDVFDLEAEHEKIDELVKRLSAIVNRIEQDQELPRAAVYRAVREYIDFMRHHMSKEETSFLPLAESYLGPDDWADIAKSLMSVKHPMVDRAMADRGAVLYRQIVEYE